MAGASEQSPVPLVLLPGMDGTARLFSRFVSALPDTYEPVEVPYPTTGKEQTYDEIERLVRDRLESISRPFVLVGESFSGPVAIRIAATPPPSLLALVLVATFVVPPVSRFLRPFARPFIFKRPPPRAAIRHLLTGLDSPDSVVDEVVDAIRLVSSHVMASRVRQVLSVDVREVFSAVELPMLFVAGSADRLVKADRRMLHDLNPRLKWADVAAPHSVLQTTPEASAEAICSFVRDLPTAGAR